MSGAPTTRMQCGLSVSHALREFKDKTFKTRKGEILLRNLGWWGSKINTAQKTAKKFPIPFLRVARHSCVSREVDFHSCVSIPACPRSGQETMHLVVIVFLLTAALSVNSITTQLWFFWSIAINMLCLELVKHLVCSGLSRLPSSGSVPF